MLGYLQDTVSSCLNSHMRQGPKNICSPLERKTPTQYSGLQPDSVDFQEYFDAWSLEEQIMCVRYVERDAFRYAFKFALVVGLIIGFCFGFLLAQNHYSRVLIEKVFAGQ